MNAVIELNPEQVKDHIKFYVTFGHAHKYPNGYVKIWARNYHCARMLAFKLYGAEWSHIYDNNDELLSLGVTKVKEYIQE